MNTSNRKNWWPYFLIFSLLMGVSFYFYIAQLEEFRFTIYQERDIFRAYDIFTRKIGIFYGPDTRTEGLLSGPFFYFLLAALTPFTDYWRSSYYVLIAFQSIFAALTGLALYRKYGLVSLSVLIGWLFLTAYPTNQFLKFFNPSYLPIFMLLCTLLLARLLEKPNEFAYRVIFLIGFLCGVGVQIHGQFFYFIFTSLLALVIYKEKRALVYLFFLLGLLSPFAGAWVYYKLSGYEIIYPQSGAYVAFEMKNFVKKILNRSTEFGKISFRALDFFTFLFPVAIAVFIGKRKYGSTKTAPLLAVSLLLASISWIGVLPYLLAGTTSRYAQSFSFAIFIFIACSIGEYFASKTRRIKAIAAATILAVFSIIYSSTPFFLRNDYSFSDIGMTKMLMIYRLTKSMSGLDGILLSSRIFSLNTQYEQLTFKAFEKFSGAEGERLPEYPVPNSDLSFFIFRDYAGEGYSEDWLKEKFPLYLPEIIHTAIKKNEIRILRPIIFQDIWLIPYMPGAEKKYPSGFTNFTYGYTTEKDQLFLENKMTKDSDIEIVHNDSKMKEVNFQWTLCQTPQTEYCLVNQKIGLRPNSSGTNLLIKINGAGLTNNTVFKDAYSIVMEQPTIDILCGKKNLRFQPVDLLGSAIGGFGDYLKNISAPFEVSIQTPCKLDDIRSVKSAYQYYLRSEPTKKMTQLEAIF